MKIDKIVLSFYMKNQDVVRIKFSPYLIMFALFVVIVTPFMFFADIGHQEVSKQASNIVADVIRQPANLNVKNEIKKSDVILDKSKISTGEYRVKYIQQFKKEDVLSVKFFLTKADVSNTDIKSGVVTGVLTDEKGESDSQSKQSDRFSFRSGRNTEFNFPLAQVGDAKYLLVKVVKDDNLKFQKKILLK